MPDQFQNPVVPPVPPPAEASSPPAEPVPLPKATDIEPPPAPPPGTPSVGTIPKPEAPHPLFEKPVTVAPGAKSEQRKENREQRKLPKGVIAGIATLVFLVMSTFVISRRVARDPDWGRIGIKAANGCSNGLCPVYGCGGERKVCGYIKTDQPVYNGSYQDVLDARANLVINDLGSKEDQQRIQEAPSVKVEENRIVRNEATDRVETTDGGQIPTYDEVKTYLQENKLANTQENVSKIVEQVNSGSSGVTTDFDGVDVVPAGTTSGGKDAAACYGLGDRDLEAKCIADAKGGQYKAGDCRTQNCLGLPNVHVVYCQGPQESADSPRAGEFLTCGPQFTSTGGCGQADVYESEAAYKAGERPIGFIIDKSNCAPATPQVTTEEAPPREFPPEPPTPPGATATPTPVTISANCQSLVGQVSDGAGGWVTKTDAEFSAAARPGDRVRFVCTGAKTRGSFTKSAFFINNILHVDDVVKLNDTQFAVEYTIPAAGALTVESVLLHDSKGWVD